MICNYLQVLEESLHKKKNVLDRIEKLCMRQEEILKAETVPEEEFDASLEEKGELIDELNRLDEGFEGLYGNIREQLMAGKEQYKKQIAVLQQLIKEVTEQSVSIQTQEARNKVLAEKFFSGRRKEIQRGRANSKAAINYYRNMSQTHVVTPQFMDEKN